jgi:hypothetical protein
MMAGRSLRAALALFELDAVDTRVPCPTTVEDFYRILAITHEGVKVQSRRTGIHALIPLTMFRQSSYVDSHGAPLAAEATENIEHEPFWCEDLRRYVKSIRRTTSSTNVRDFKWNLRKTKQSALEEVWYSVRAEHRVGDSGERK